MNSDVTGAPQFELQTQGKRNTRWLGVFLGLLLLQAMFLYLAPQLYLWFRVDRWFEYTSVGSWIDVVLALPNEALMEFLIVIFPESIVWLVLARICAVRWYRSNQSPRGVSNLHGSARWASPAEVFDSGLLPQRFKSRRSSVPHKGVFVGAYDHEKHRYYLKHNGPEHILCFAPTRTGKGISLVVPTLLDWRESLLVFDMKGELWQLSSGWRKDECRNRVFKFEPGSDEDDVAAYNPLAEIRLGTNREVPDVQNIAQMVVDPDAAGEQDHWAMTAQSLLTAVILHVSYMQRNEKDRVATFQDVLGWFGEVGVTLDARLKAMQVYPHCDGRPHPIVAQEAQSMLNRPEKERGSTASSAEKYLTIYRDPIVARNTSRSDWKVQDLMNGDQPASVYIVISPADLERMRLLVRLVMMQVVRKIMETKVPMADGRPKPTYRHRLLLMLDEFTALKKMASIEDTIPYMASYGIKCYLIVQDIDQLAKIYGDKEALVSNCHIRVTFNANKYETAEKISKMAGKSTVIKEQYSSSGKRSRFRNESISTSKSEVQRDLIRPEEVMALQGLKVDTEGNVVEPGQMLIFAGANTPILGTQPLYFQDPELSRRAKISPPRNSDCMDPGRNRRRKSGKAKREPGFPDPNEAVVAVGGTA